MDTHQPKLQQLASAITATGFTALILILSVLLISSVGQIQDILVQVEYSSTLVHRFGFVVSACWFSIITWWTARLVFEQMAAKTHQESAEDDRDIMEIKSASVAVREGVTRWLPRAYAVVLPLVLIIHSIHKELWWVLILSVLFVLLPVVVLIVRRRLLVKKITHYLQQNNKHRLASVCFHSWTWGYAVSILYVLFTVWALVDPYSLGRLLGAFFVVYWGLGSVLFALTIAVCVLLPKVVVCVRKKIEKWVPSLKPILERWTESSWFQPPHPILLTVVVYAIIIANVFNTDNHLVRRIPVDAPQYAYQDFDSAWQHFVDNLATSDLYITQDGTRQYPIFFVASQGGGLRAAYWSSVGMSYLKQEVSGIEKNTFSLAGVSGGSVGNVFFAAGLEDNETLADKDCQKLKASERLPCSSASAVGKDYLSPVLTSFLYNDLLYRFFPIQNWHFLYRDRAAVLETSWQDGFNDVYGSNTLDQGLQGLYREQQQWLPLVLSMGSHQETGTRLIAAPFPIDPEIFVNQYSTYRLMGCEQGSQLSCDMRLSTTALTSARFPYVTPAGTLAHKKNWAEKDHIIDGGYVENYGLIATRSMLDYLNREQRLTIKVDGETAQLLPVIIVFANDSDMELASINPLRDLPYLNTGSMPLNEITNPIQGLLSTRTGRSVQSLTETIDQQQQATSVFDQYSYTFGEDKKAVTLNDTLVFHLPKSESIVVPLGWWLSEESQTYMSQQYQQPNAKAHQLIQQLKNKLNR